MVPWLRPIIDGSEIKAGSMVLWLRPIIASEDKANIFGSEVKADSMVPCLRPCIDDCEDSTKTPRL